MKIGSIIKDSLILFAITLVLGLALSGTKVATQDAIDEAARVKKEKGFIEVCKITDKEASGIKYNDVTEKCVSIQKDFKDFDSKKAPELLVDKEGADAVYEVIDPNGIRGYIAQVTSKGFGGALKIIVGFDIDGKITGVKYSETPSETPGVGMKTTAETWLGQWSNKKNISSENVKDVYTNKELGVDTVSGATISSTAFKDAVRLACAAVDVAKGGK